MNTQILNALNTIAKEQKKLTDSEMKMSKKPTQIIKTGITINAEPMAISLDIPEPEKPQTELSEFDLYKKQIDELSDRLKLPLTDLLFKAISCFHTYVFSEKE